MSKRKRRDRTGAIKHDVDNKGMGDYGAGKRFTKMDGELEDIGVSQYRAESGKHGESVTHRFHVLPPHPDDGDPIVLKLFVHWGVGEGSAYLCPSTMKKVFEDYGIEVPAIIDSGKCPICDKASQLRKRLKAKKEKEPDGDFEAREQEIKDHRPNLRYLMWCLDAADEDTENEGVKFYVTPYSVYQGYLDESVGDDGEVIDLADPDDGYIFSFRKSGQGQYKTEYRGFKSRKRGFQMEDEVLDSVPHYVDVLSFSSYEDMEADFLGETEAAEKQGEQVKDELAGEFQKSKDKDEKRSVRRTRRKVEDDEPDEDDEPEEKETKTRRRTRKVQEEDDDDDDKDSKTTRKESEDDDDDDTVNRIRRNIQRRRDKKGKDE